MNEMIKPKNLILIKWIKTSQIIKEVDFLHLQRILNPEGSSIQNKRTIITLKISNKFKSNYNHTIFANFIYKIRPIN